MSLSSTNLSSTDQIHALENWRQKKKDAEFWQFQVASTVEKISVLTAALAEVQVPGIDFMCIKEFTGHPFYGTGYGRSGLDLDSNSDDESSHLLRAIS